jgi:DNA invertase Pin-like site-specific DNA recombinase
MKKVAIYVRVSTGHQDHAMQLVDLRRYVEQRGWQVYQEYADTASGSKESRPALELLMNDARKRKFDAVLVWRFDRYARSTKHLVTALSEFKGLGIDFISYQENLDTGTSMGEAMFSIIAALAQLERDIIRDRVRGGLRAAREKGQKLGRPPKLDNSKIRELRSSGLSVRAIAAQLSISKSAVQRALVV